MKTQEGFRVLKQIARWTEQIGLRWAITKAAWAGKYPPPTLAEAREWFHITPRNQFYDDHFVGVKATKALRAKHPEPKGGTNG